MFSYYLSYFYRRWLCRKSKSVQKISAGDGEVSERLLNLPLLTDDFVSFTQKGAIFGN